MFHLGQGRFRTPFKMTVPSYSALFEGIGGDFGYVWYCLSSPLLDVCYPYKKCWLFSSSRDKYYVCFYQKRQFNIIWNSIYAGKVFGMSLFFSRTFNLQNDIKSHCHIVLNIVSLLSNDFAISMHFFYQIEMILLVSPDFCPVSLVRYYSFKWHHLSRMIL